jgi:hypothetical protein
VRAWKFLDRTGRAVFSGHPWPLSGTTAPGPWLEAGPAALCGRGIHACRAADLSWWIHDELWEVELSGEVVEGDHKLAAPRGRLVRRVDGWAGGAARALAETSAWRALDLAMGVLAGQGLERQAEQLSRTASLEDLQRTGFEVAGALGELSDGGLAAALAGDAASFARHGAPPLAPYVAACAAGHAARAGSASRSYREGFVAERAVQSAWVVRRLGLDEPAGGRV